MKKRNKGEKRGEKTKKKHVSFSECKKCMRNEDIGWRQGNIYFCDDPDLPECCELQMEFTCCEPGPIRAM